MKRIALFLLVIGFVFYSNAQKRNGLGLHLGSIASNTYDITNGYFGDIDPQPGYQVGLRYNFKLGPVGVCSEFNYNSINYKEPISLYDINLNYISIPILFKLYIGGFNIHVGGQASYLVGGNNGLGDITDDAWYYDMDGVDTWLYNDTDIAAVFGLGLDMKRLYITWRSTASLTPIGNVDVSETFLGFDSDDLLRLVSSSLSIGFQF